jgi:hypothetical protein
MMPWIPGAMAAAGLAAGLMAGMLCVWLYQRGRSARRAGVEELRGELGRVRVDCLAEVGRIRKELEERYVESQATAELCEGRLSGAGRSRAMRMLRAGIAPETAAAELGIARSEVELMRAVAGALTGRE